jgi:hypothetical protein
MRIVLLFRGRGSPEDNEAAEPGGRDDNDDAGCFSEGESSCRRTSERYQAGHPGVDSGLVVVYGPTPKARVQPVHHTARVTGGSLHCVVPNAATSRSLAWNATRPPGSPETKPEERAWPGWKSGLKPHTREAAGPA